ncbi:hypothetical protein LSAT2_006684, partial [Lamellibrachia satsuma]
MPGIISPVSTIRAKNRVPLWAIFLMGLLPVVIGFTYSLVEPHLNKAMVKLTSKPTLSRTVDEVEEVAEVADAADRTELSKYQNEETPLVDRDARPANSDII